MNNEQEKYYDKACIDLCRALNKLDGVKTYSSCCGHGKDEYRIWFNMDSMSSGAYVLAFCLYGRHYCYAEGEKIYDQVWHIKAEWCDAYNMCFVLIGKPMPDDSDTYDPAERLARNLNERGAFDYIKTYKRNIEGRLRTPPDITLTNRPQGG